MAFQPLERLWFICQQEEPKPGLFGVLGWGLGVKGRAQKGARAELVLCREFGNLGLWGGAGGALGVGVKWSDTECRICRVGRDPSENATESKWESQKGGKHPKNLWSPTQPIPQPQSSAAHLKVQKLNFNRFRQLQGMWGSWKGKSFSTGILGLGSVHKTRDLPGPALVWSPEIKLQSSIEIHLLKYY